MTRIKSTVLIAESLKKYLYGNCTEEETAMIEKWLENPSNKSFFKKFKNDSAHRMMIHQDLDLSIARNALRNEFEKDRKFRIYRSSWLVAASVIILMGLGTIFFLNKETPISQEKYIAAFNLYVPGENKAVLSTSDGNKIVLEKDAPEKMIAEKDGTRINIGGDVLSYENQAELSGVMLYNTMEVPRNGEHSLVLSDGTKIWLNSESKLRYPVSFIGNTREVYLEGEAYFEVAHNAQKKFIVHTEKSIVEVKGTSFNMQAYKGETNITTLVEGSVDIRHKYDERSTVSLKPGDQAKVISVNHKIRVNKVETLYYTSWKDGYFAYKETSLENILKQLSRWYDFNYKYDTDDVMNEVFTARLKRYNSVGEIFYILEQTGKVRFRSEGNKVVVMAKE